MAEQSYFQLICGEDRDGQYEALLGLVQQFYNSRWAETTAENLTMPQTSASTIVTLRKDEQYYTSLLRKTILYSDPVILVSPIDVHVENRSRELEMRGNVAHVCELNSIHRDLVERGACVFLPRTLVEEWDGGCSDDPTLTSYEPPIVQPAGSMEYLPLGTQPITPGHKDYFIYRNILLPYFPNANLVDVARIAQEETDSFARFNHFLKQKLADIAVSESPSCIADLIAEIENEVAALTLEARKIAKGGLRRNTSMGLFGISLSVLLMGGSALSKNISGVLGSISLFEILKEFVNKQTDELSLRASPFYVPYLLTSDESTFV